MDKDDIERLIATTEAKVQAEAEVQGLLTKLDGQLEAIAETNLELREVIRELCIGNTDVSSKLDAILTLIATHVKLQRAEVLNSLVSPTTIVVEAGTRFEGETQIESGEDMTIAGHDVREGE